jgi:hypothetical protein
MTPTQNEIEKKQLIYFLGKYKKRMTGIVKANEKKVNKKQTKLKQYKTESISNKKAFKITRKISESQRNVKYYKSECNLANQAMGDITHNRDTYEVNQAKARNALDHIKSEMSLILGLALFIYLMLNGAAIMVPILKSLLPVMMVLITVVCVAIYDMKCKQYNAVQQNEDSKIDDTLIAVGRPSIFGWYGAIVLVAIVVISAIPYCKMIISPYF